jgi:NAD(P)-dependent dehydrogenase (short-subunit alcohol dehydrogenase family)
LAAQELNVACQPEEAMTAVDRDHLPRHGRGVEPEDVVAALRYFVGAAAVTGQVITIDGGHRFLGLARDVQFLGSQ